MRISRSIMVLLSLTLTVALLSVAGGADQQRSFFETSAAGGYQADLDGLRRHLASAPLERSGEAKLELLLPLDARTLARFRVEEAPVISGALAARYPEIRTYRIRGVDDPTAVGRIGFTSRGFHGRILGVDGRTILETRRTADGNVVAAYKSRGRGFDCALEEDLSVPGIAALTTGDTPVSFGDNRYTFRLAVNATGEFTQSYNNQNQAVARVVETVNEMNVVFERDNAVTLSLVYCNAYPDPNTDPFTGSFLVENHDDLAAKLGNANYDVGHLYHVGAANGAAAAVGTICNDTNKGGAYSTYPDPEDPILVDYVMHELGHQFGADHTFNTKASNGNCNGCSMPRGVEPGSGSTIMSYAGLCGACDILPTNDDYFHGFTQSQIWQVVDPATCPSVATGVNQIPSLSPLTAYNIPPFTAFTLTASATDADSDPLTYCWEQLDRTTFAQSWPEYGPLYRTFLPLSEPSRTFPTMDVVMAGMPTDIHDAWELPAQGARDLKFRVTVRDGNGGVDMEEVTLTTVGGGFSVTQPNGGEGVNGSSVTVTWQRGDYVALGTTHVDIYFMHDEDPNDLDLRVANTPNDGLQQVPLPNRANQQARVLIRPVGNIYFDISDAPFVYTYSQGGGGGGKETPTQASTGDPQTAAALLEVSPSVFHGATQIMLNLGEDASGPVAGRVEVYNVAGRLVRTLHDGPVRPKQHFTWRPADDGVASGVYFLRAVVGERTVSKKVVVRP